MSKLVIPIILSVVVMIAGVFAFMPVEKASTVHATIGPLTILSVEKTLLNGAGDSGGPDVTWTLTAISDVIVHQFYHDNTPTADAGKCSLTPPHNHNDKTVHCFDSEYRMLDMVVAGSQFKTKDFLNAGDNNRFNEDHVEIREYPRMLDNIPLKAGDTITVTFDSGKGSNDIILDVSFGVTGTAKLE